MSKRRLTVDDLLLSNSASISLKEAADVLNMGYKTVLKMAKQNTFPAENCLIKLNDNGEYSKYVVMRVKFISYITGLSYEEQLDYKKRILKKRENELKNYTEEEKEKIDKIINKIKE